MVSGYCNDLGFHKGRLRDVRTSWRQTLYILSWRWSVRLHPRLAPLQHATYTQVWSRQQQQLCVITADTADQLVGVAGQQSQWQQHRSTAIIVQQIIHLISLTQCFIYQVAQKMSKLTKCNFSTDIDFLSGGTSYFEPPCTIYCGETSPVCQVPPKWSKINNIIGLVSGEANLSAEK